MKGYLRKAVNQTIFAEWKRNYTFRQKLKKIQQYHSRELARVQNKKQIKVAFFLIHEAVWKYDGVYALMEKDKRFEPVIVICPYTAYGKKVMLKEMNNSYDTFTSRGYKVVKSYTDKKDEWLDVKKDIKPDIIFFTNPWNLTKREYHIENYLDTLTCYVPYGYKCSHLHEAHYNKPMHNFTWKFYAETQTHKKLAKKYSRNRGKNIEVAGYPGMDKLLDSSYAPADDWKINSKSYKRIIWAPHHSIPGYGAGLDYSTFMIYYDFFIQMAEKYRNEIQFAFKPHPILRHKLSSNDVWGPRKTNEYFDRWKNLDNGLVAEGDYIDLFATSDAMFHDGASFLIDYLYTKNPVIYLIRDETVKERFNSLGKKSFDCHYHAKNKDDIEKFLKMIISEKDEKLVVRERVFNEYVKAPNQVTASENIFNSIKQSIQ